MVSPKLPSWNLRAKDREVSRRIALFKKFILNFIKDRIYEINEGRSKKEDYISQLYNSVHEKERTPEFLESIVSDFSTLFMAGTDTTSHSAMMLIYFIIMHPEVRMKL